MKFFHALFSPILLCSLTFLSACGGGGGGGQTAAANNGGGQTAPALVSLVTGVAATGTPIAGTVTLKDRNGALRGPTATDSEGGYSFDVTNLAPPFILKVEWTADSRSNSLFSVALTEGNAHINPLSDLALKLASGSDPGAVFGMPGATPDTTRISNQTLATATAQLKTLLSPLLAEYGITEFEPINGRYIASPDNKLDTLLDVVMFKTENGSLTISNKLDGSVIATGSMANLTAIAVDKAKSPAKAVLSDIQEITGRVGVLCSAMNLGASLKAGNLEDLFISDPGYGLSSGLTRVQDMASIVTLFGPGGSNTNGKLRSIRNVTLVSDQTAKYTSRGVSKVYVLNYDFIFENGVIEEGHNVTFGKEAASGLWKFIGDAAGSTGGNNVGGILRGYGFRGGLLPPPGPGWLPSPDNPGGPSGGGGGGVIDPQAR